MLSHWLGVTHSEVSPPCRQSGRFRGDQSVTVPTTGDLTGLFLLQLSSTLCAAQLYFSLRVEGAPPSWSHWPLFLRRKLERGISGMNHRPYCCSPSWGYNWYLPNPSTQSTQSIPNCSLPQLSPHLVLMAMSPSMSLWTFHLCTHYASFGVAGAEG